MKPKGFLASRLEVGKQRCNCAREISHRIEIEGFVTAKLRSHPDVMLHDGTDQLLEIVPSGLLRPFVSADKKGFKTDV
jgi:hypothetical protein